MNEYSSYTGVANKSYSDQATSRPEFSNHTASSHQYPVCMVRHDSTTTTIQSGVLGQSTPSWPWPMEVRDCFRVFRLSSKSCGWAREGGIHQPTNEGANGRNATNDRYQRGYLTVTVCQLAQVSGGDAGDDSQSSLPCLVKLTCHARPHVGTTCVHSPSCPVSSFQSVHVGGTRETSDINHQL